MGLNIRHFAHLIGAALALSNAQQEREQIKIAPTHGKNRPRAHCVNSGVMQAKRAAATRNNIRKRKPKK